MKCNACEKDAIMVYRLNPYSAVTLFDATARDVAACKAHLETARQIGHVISATSLSDAVTVRTVAE